MCVKFSKVKYKIKDYWVYEKREYNIIKNNIEVGTIKYIKTNKVFFIKGLYLKEEYKKQGIGTLVIDYILNNYKIDYIMGEALIESRGFWAKMIKKYNGFRRNITYSENCSSTFIIPKAKCTSNDIYNRFGDNCDLYYFIKECTES